MASAWPSPDPVVVQILRAALALLFASHAISKLRAPRHFARTLAAYRLLPAPLVAPAAATLVACEGVLAAGLATPASDPRVGIGAALLLTLYAAAIALNLARGRRHIDCGCAGPWREQPLHPALIVRNGVLVLGCLVASATPVSRALGWIDGFTVAASVAFLALLWIATATLLAQAPALRALAAPAGEPREAVASDPAHGRGAARRGRARGDA